MLETRESKLGAPVVPADPFWCMEKKGGTV